MALSAWTPSAARSRRWARTRDPAFITVVWLTIVLKLAGAVLGFALVQPSGRRVPRWLLLSAALAASTILVLYGAVQITGLVLAPPENRTVFLWRLFLWEPWFLVWGLLLGAATWAAVRLTRRPHSA